MNAPVRRTLRGTVAGLAVGSCTLALAAPTATAQERPDRPATDAVADLLAADAGRATGERAPGTGTAQDPRHASDGKAGWVAAPSPAARRAPATLISEQSWSMAPGIDYRTWDQLEPRGPSIPQTVRFQLVTVDIVNPANSFDLLSTEKVAAGTTVHKMAEATGAVAAVNGDFFDIGDTGAPLGVGRARKGGLRHAPESGWNSSFWVDGNGRPHVGELPFVGKFRNNKHPNITFSGFNSPVVPRGGVGVYTAKWGKTRGYSVTDGAKRARQVVIRKGRVVSNRYGLTSGKKIQGKLLVGRGAGAGLLKRLRKGERLGLKWRVKGSPKVAVSGDRPLLVDGQRVVVNDQLMHPRTAVGIDEDANKVLILTVDGRQAHSRGYTMVELANMMTALGAENAINLDGGGSTTMVAHSPTGELSVLNSPSDGAQRRVPNGLGVFSNPIS